MTPLNNHCLRGTPSFSHDVPAKGEKPMRFESIPTENVRPNPRQPREGFPREDIKDLADLIRKLGPIQPIVVHEHRGGYQTIAGERR